MLHAHEAGSDTLDAATELDPWNRGGVHGGGRQGGPAPLHSWGSAHRTLVWLGCGQVTDLAAPPTGPPGYSTRTPASSLPEGAGKLEGQPRHLHPSPPPPPPEGLVPCSLQLHRPLVSEQKQVPPTRVVPRSFPQSCLGQKPGRRVASLCGPRRAGHPPHDASAGSCSQDSPPPPSCIIPTVPGDSGEAQN